MQIIQFFASSPCESTLARRYVLAAEGERHALDRSGQLRRDLAAPLPHLLAIFFPALRSG